MTDYELFATCPKGLEYLLADEIRDMGLTVSRMAAAGVWLQADLAGAMRFCLWSRLANRLVLYLADYPVRSGQDLAPGAAEIPWEDHLNTGGSFRVFFQGVSDEIRNTLFGAQCIKDGVMDRMARLGLTRPQVSEDPDLHIHARLHKGRVSLGINLAGESLHRRGYRTEAGEAPLKENLAAALLHRAGWPELATQGADLVDPLCGSGTILIEGALMATDTAPGLTRSFAFERWPHHDPVLWQGLLDEALERREAGRRASRSRFRGFDRDRQVIATAWRNIERAELSDRVHVERVALDELALPETATPGLVLTNPPYGERLSERKQLASLYRTLGERVRDCAQGWRLGVFTAVPEMGHQIGLQSHRQYRLFNGTLPAQLLLFEVTPERNRTPRTDPEEEDPDTLPPARIANQERADMLANRLRKNRKALKNWLRKNDIECYRLYDADMPEYSLAVDCYGDWLHVQEYAPPSSLPVKAARERLGEAMAVLPEAVGVACEQVVVKQRRRQKGTEQYEKQAQTEHFMTVTEGGSGFRVNLHDYLDTGLFLDHRPVRLWIRDNASGKRFLNLFCYTGAVTVHAAAGGAESSLSLDMSNTYLDWARQNWQLNGMDEKRHRLERADCVQWLAEPASETFDLIFLDPPTFSNSSRMEEVLDVQRDHESMIEGAMKRLAPVGVLIFSTNFRRFRLDEAVMERYRVTDATAWSIDRDYARNQRIHQCWFIRHPEQ